jgi:hypothetical protein
MRRQRLKRFSLAERVELNRQLKDAVEAFLIRPGSMSSARQFFLCENLMARLVCALTTVALMRLRVKMLTRFRVWMTLWTKLTTRTFTPTSTSPMASGKFECVTRTFTRRRFKPLMA